MVEQQAVTRYVLPFCACVLLTLLNPMCQTPTSHRSVCPSPGVPRRYHRIDHSFHHMKMRLMPRHEGWGVKASDLVSELCGLVGIRNVSIKMVNASKNKFFVAQCFQVRAWGPGLWGGGREKRLLQGALRWVGCRMWVRLGGYAVMEAAGDNRRP